MPPSFRTSARAIPTPRPSWWRKRPQISFSKTALTRWRNLLACRAGPYEPAAVSLPGVALVRAHHDVSRLHAQHRRPLRGVHRARSDPARAASHGPGRRDTHGFRVRIVLRRVGIPAVLAH